MRAHIRRPIDSTRKGQVSREWKTYVTFRISKIWRSVQASKLSSSLPNISSSKSPRKPDRRWYTDFHLVITCTTHGIGFDDIQLITQASLKLWFDTVSGGQRTSLRRGPGPDGPSQNSGTVMKFGPNETLTALVSHSLCDQLLWVGWMGPYPEVFLPQAGYNKGPHWAQNCSPLL